MQQAQFRMMPQSYTNTNRNMNNRNVFLDAADEDDMDMQQNNYNYGEELDALEAEMDMVQDYNYAATEEARFMPSQLNNYNDPFSNAYAGDLMNRYAQQTFSQENFS